MLILTIAKDFNKLLKNCSLASIAPLSKLCGVVEMAINLAIVLVVAVLCAKYRGTHRTSEVINMVFLVQSCDV